MPKSVYAIVGHLSSLEIDVEDVASILMGVHIDGHIVPVHLHQDFLQSPPSRTCKVIGDNGKIFADLTALTVTSYRRDGPIVEVKDFSGFERNKLFQDEMAHFIGCLDSGDKPCVTIREGAQSLSMALAAKKSLVDGNVIDFSNFNEVLV